MSSKKAHENTKLLCSNSPTLPLATSGPSMPPSLNRYVYAVKPKRKIKRIGTLFSQYSSAGISSREAADRSAMPKKMRITAMKAEASLGLSIVVM